MITLFLIPFYILFSIYICRWLFRWMGACHHWFQKRWIQIVIVALYAFASSTILISFFMRISPIQRVLKRIGNYWLGTLLYILLVILVVDLVRMILKRQKWVNQEKLGSKKVFVSVGAACILVIAFLSIYGIFNARVIRTTKYDVTIDKNGGKLEELKIALVADFHLGYSIGPYHMEKMVEKVNRMNADIVLIAGDIFDNEYDAIRDPERVSRILRGIKSKYGVYACYGNHDIEEKILVGFTFPKKGKKQSDPRMDEFLEKSDIQIMRDESLLIDDSFYLVSRPDYERPGRGIDKRKSPQEVTKELDQTKPIIVMEHEPREMKELSDSGVDMQLCGHTHDGQVWPGTWTIHLFWDNAYGHEKIGNMHSIVTSGIGVYGPAMRVNSKSEVCEINVRFQNGNLGE